MIYYNYFYNIKVKKKEEVGVYEVCVFVCCLSSVDDHVSHSSTVRKIQIDSSCLINALNKKIC